MATVLTVIPSTVPVPVIPTISIVSESEVTIHWTRSEAGIVLRYIVDVRRYSKDGPGEVKLDHLRGSPRVVPGIELQHTVKSLGKAVPLGSVSGIC